MFLLAIARPAWCSSFSPLCVVCLASWALKKWSPKQGTSLILSRQGWQGLKCPWSHGSLLMKQKSSVHGTRHTRASWSPCLEGERPQTHKGLWVLCQPLLKPKH